MPIGSLSPEQLQHYESQGWVAPIDVMSERQAGDVLAALEAAESQFPDELNAEHRNNAHIVFPFLADLACDGRIVDAVESIVGPDISLWSTVLFIKEPDSASFVSWHQDAFYMGLASDCFVTAWLALTPSTRRSGCVSVIPGSQRRRVEHQDTFAEDNILTRGQQVSNVDPNTAVDLVLRPGQMSLHHPWLIHGSQPNRSDARRVGLAMQSYLGAAVRPVRGDHHVMAVRGDRPDATFTSVARPRSVCDPSDVAARAEANVALSSVLYDGADETRAL